MKTIVQKHLMISMFCWRPWSIFFLWSLSEEVIVFLLFFFELGRDGKKMLYTSLSAFVFFAAHPQGLCLTVAVSCDEYLYLFRVLCLSWRWNKARTKYHSSNVWFIQLSTYLYHTVRFTTNLSFQHIYIYIYNENKKLILEKWVRKY